MQQNSVILLNADYTFLGIISWQRAMTLIAKTKVQVLKLSDKIVAGVRKNWIIPKIIRLIKFVRVIYKNKVPWSTKNVAIRDNFTCQYCGKKLTPKTSECEHVIPKSRGGKSIFENTVCACHTCNQKKANKLPSEADMYIKKQPYQPTIMEFLMIRLKNSGVEKILKDFFSEEIM